MSKNKDETLAILSELDEELGTNVTDDLSDVLEDIEADEIAKSLLKESTSESTKVQKDSGTSESTKVQKDKAKSTLLTKKHKETDFSDTGKKLIKTTTPSEPIVLAERSANATGTKVRTAYRDLILRIGELGVSSLSALVEGDQERDDNELKQLLENEMSLMADKVGKKAVNLFDALLNETKLSCYTKITLDLLIKHESDFITASMIVGEFQKQYTVGTSKSQAGQMMQLLPRLMIAKREGSTLTPNKKSVLLKKLKEKFYA